MLFVLVAAFRVDPRLASAPALVAGGVANFFLNRHFAFRARRGHLGKQAVGYTVVEIAALVLNGVLYDLVLRLVPHAAAWYWALRLVTTNVVFLGFSYPLWRRVFSVPREDAMA